jgi:Fe-S-cluster containining protein
LITDLVQIRRLGETNREENSRFRQFLKRHKYNEVKLRRIGQDIEEDIDCTQCANCCRVALVPLIERDIPKLAKAMRMSVAKFEEQYIEWNEEENCRVLKRTPEGCVFLSGNECTIYEDRPSNCVHFPHVVKGEGPISTRMWQFIDRASYCPIVYNAMEAWKDETGFRK